MIKVTVTGEAGIRKSLVAVIIRDALALAGIPVELIDDNGTGVPDEPPGVVELTRMGGRLDAIRDKGTEVKIQTQTHRPSEGQPWDGHCG